MEKINDLIKEKIAEGGNANTISDGYHTFGELYDHRAALLAIICNQNSKSAWKSRLHDDETMFIIGFTTLEGDSITYHVEKYFWDLFMVKEIDKAPEWDDCTAEDIFHSLEKWSEDMRSMSHLLSDCDDNEWVYIYDGCMGYFITEEELEEDYFCEQCGHYDTLVYSGFVRNLKIGKEGD